AGWRRPYRIGHLGGCGQTAMRRSAAVALFAVECRALPSLGPGRYNCLPGPRQQRSNQDSVMGESFPGTPPSVRQSEDRLDSWKEIAAYLNRDVTTVQRWEKREGMPVHRHLHDRMGSVHASRAELDAWARGRNLRAAQEYESNATSLNPPTQRPRSAASTSLTRWR